MVTKRAKSKPKSNAEVSAPKQVQNKAAAPPSHEQIARKKTENKPAAPPSREQIAQLAEKYWTERGRPFGSSEQDWLRAERELMGKAS